MSLQTAINNRPHVHVPYKRHSPGASYNVYYYHLSLFELYYLFIYILFSFAYLSIYVLFIYLIN